MICRSPRLAFVLIVCLILAFTASNVSAQTALADKIKKLRKSSSSKTPTTAVAPESIAYQKMLRSVALLQMFDGESIYSGTAWLIDAENRVFLTNQHVIENFDECDVYFPEFVSGKLVTDPDQSIRDDRAYYGKVIDSDISFDLALVQVEGDLPEGIEPLEIADSSASPGDEIHSLAGSTVGSQSLWVYSTGHVRQIVRGDMANGYEATLLESDMATNQGNSGGPVCDDEGRVVAVVEGHRTDARLVSIYVSQESLVEYLSDALRCVNPTTVEDLQFAAQRHSDEYRIYTALELATEALKLDPDNAELCVLRGWCWYYMDDYANSIADFDEAIRLNRTLSEPHYGKGRWAEERGEGEEAIKHMSTAIRNDVSNASYYVGRGKVYGKLLGQWDKALRDFDTAVGKNAYYSEAIRSRGYAYIELGDTANGLEDLELVVEEFAEDPSIFYYYGFACFQDDNLEEAEQFLATSLKIDSEYGKARVMLAGLLLDQNRYAEVEEHVNVLMSIESEDPLLHYWLGICYYNTGNGDSLEALKRATELDPNDEDYAQAYRTVLEESNQGAAETQQKYVATNSSIPREYVGTWTAVLAGNGKRVDYKITVQENGRFQMEGRLSTGGRVNNVLSSEGALRIEKSDLIFEADDPSASERFAFNWRNDHLLLYLKDQRVWITFNRQ